MGMTACPPPGTPRTVVGAATTKSAPSVAVAVDGLIQAVAGIGRREDVGGERCVGCGERDHAVDGCAQVYGAEHGCSVRKRYRACRCAGARVGECCAEQQAGGTARRGWCDGECQRRCGARDDEALRRAGACGVVGITHVHRIVGVCAVSDKNSRRRCTVPYRHRCHDRAIHIEKHIAREGCGTGAGRYNDRIQRCACCGLRVGGRCGGDGFADREGRRGVAAGVQHVAAIRGCNRVRADRERQGEGVGIGSDCLR